MQSDKFAQVFIDVNWLKLKYDRTFPTPSLDLKYHGGSNWSALWMCCVSLTAPCEVDTWAGRGTEALSSLGHMFQIKFPLKLLSP